MLEGFKKFVLRGNVVDLAVGVVVGAAFTNIVNSFVKDILTPIMAIPGGKPDFSGLSVKIGNGSFMIGNFLNAVISFLIVAGVIYFFVVTPLNRLQAMVKTKEEKVSRSCPFCRKDIDKKATRCPFCTSKLS